MDISDVLVLGGAGFVGSNLCRYLVEQKIYRVFSLDNYFTGTSDNHVAGVEYINGDTADINDLCRDIHPNFVFHLAEYSRVEKSFDEPELVWQMSANSIMKVLSYCRDKNTKLIYAGSSTKFGHNDFDRNSSPYAFLKAQNSELVSNYSKWYNLEYAITYFYNVYGPGEISQGDYSTVIAKFTELTRHGEPLTVVSPGDQRRNFTHVDDIVKALFLIASRGSGDGYGIGHSEEYSVMEVAKMFGGKIKMLPPRPGNRMSAELITDKTKALGWSPDCDLRSYIQSIKN